MGFPTSSCVRSEAIGLRSSCEASATKRRCRSTEASSTVRVSLVVRASRAISSRESGSGTRRRRSSDAVIADSSLRMPSTGRRALRVTSQVTPATTASRTGRPVSMAPRTVSTASCSVARGHPRGRSG